MRSIGNFGLSLAAVAVCGAISSSAFAQRNFSRSQQAGMQAYITQLQTQNRIRQQQQMQQVARQFDRQQSEIDISRRRLAANQDEIDAAVDPNYRQYRRSRGSASFGSMHYQSDYFQRVNPYYDY